MNRNFKHNATKFYLLTNQDVLFTSNDGIEFKIKLPTVKSLYTDKDLSFCISFMQLDKEDLAKLISVPVGSYADFIHIINNFNMIDKGFFEITNKIMNGLKWMNEGFHFDKVLKIDDIIIEDELLNQIVYVINLSVGVEKTFIEEKDDEFTRMEKQAKIRAERIRRNSEQKEKTSIEDIIVAILYEFPQYKIDDIMQMNLYTVYYLFKYIGRIANYEVDKIAFGNGAVKKGQKFKYFIEK